MNQTAGVQRSRNSGIPIELQQEFDTYRNIWSAYGPPVTITQQEVDAFTTLTGDENPIHKADAELPILPGLFTVALLPRLLGNKLPLSKPGRTIYHSVIKCNFKRAIPIGRTIWMRYRGVHLNCDHLSPQLLFDFEIALVDTRKDVAEGCIELRVA